MSEPEFNASDGTTRKSHYGEGRQPWDDIVDMGWAPDFAAGNALKYVRRYANKNGEDDIKKGRWYYAELRKMAIDPDSPWWTAAAFAITNLKFLLSKEEIKLLEAL